MTDISSFTHKWRATPAVAQQNEGNKVNKRNRQPVSCVPCRLRKLKCDRGHPCDACTKRNDGEACVYGKVASPVSHRREESKSNIKAQERLRHLEELVRQLIGPEQGASTPQTPPVGDHRPPEGSLNKDVNGITYTGSTHWATVLDQIQELRNTLSPTASPEDENDRQLSGGNVDSLFAAPQPPPLNVILQKYLPPREDCNRYLSTYFDAKYITVPFLHTYQFKRQYERFWDNQLETSPIWVSILFSILCIADGIRRAPLSLLRADGDQARPKSPFLSASAQCLVLGNYARLQPHIVEALAMFGQCKYAVTLDPSHELSLIFSILSRQAYTMGYHREPSIFKNQFTVFEGEMRRRAWSLLKQFDLMVSFQKGLPVIMQHDSSDTHLPSHLLDEDFDEDATVLPPPRPNTEPTQMLYIITKARLMDTYGKVCTHTLTFPKQPYTTTDINGMDDAISQAVESIPPILRARSMSHSYADPPHLTMTRSNLMFLGEKARVILHRKYMVGGPNADHSRQKCIESATRTIKHFIDLHAELQPGGQLFNNRWMLTSFTINDFLLALMVLCLAFSLCRKKFFADGGNADRWLEEDSDAMNIYDLLERAHPVCAEYGMKARESKHVAGALRLVLTKLRPENRATSQVRTPDFFVAGRASTGPSAVAFPTESHVEKMPLDIMPLSIHGNDVSMNGMSTLPLYQNQASDITPASSYDLNTMSTTGPLTFLNMNSNPTEPSPSSSWDLMEGPLPNILEGPEQIDWVQFDQFLWTYAGSGNAEEDMI